MSRILSGKPWRRIVECVGEFERGQAEHFIRKSDPRHADGMRGWLRDAPSCLCILECGHHAFVTATATSYQCGTYVEEGAFR